MVWPRVRDTPLKPAAVYRIAIAEGILGRGLTRKSFDELLCRPLGGRVIGHIEMDGPTPFVGQHDQHDGTLNPTVGTVKKSKATSSVRWFLRKTRHEGEGARRRRTRYFSTADFATAIPNFSKSPRIRGEPHSRLAVEISRINSRISLLTSGRPGRPVRLRRGQCLRKRWRCHAMTVAGCTKTTTSRHREQPRDSHD